MTSSNPHMTRADRLATLFPSEDPKTWNGGVWPPAILRPRWRELFTAALHDGVARCDDTDSAVDVARNAADIADQALRIEVERGF